LDCRFQKSDYSVFAGLNPMDRTYPFTIFLTSLSLSHTHKNNCEGDPKTPIGDFLFLRGILKFLGEIDYLRTSVSVPQPVFPHLKVFSHNPQSLCPMDEFEIPLVYCLHSCHRTIPCNISKFP
jgi:hypothetical protein